MPYLVTHEWSHPSESHHYGAPSYPACTCSVQASNGIRPPFPGIPAYVAASESPRVLGTSFDCPMPLAKKPGRTIRAAGLFLCPRKIPGRTSCFQVRGEHRFTAASGIKLAATFLKLYSDRNSPDYGNGPGPVATCAITKISGRSPDLTHTLLTNISRGMNKFWLQSEMKF